MQKFTVEIIYYSVALYFTSGFVSGLWGGSLGLMFLSVTKTATEAMLVLSVSMGLTAGVFSGIFLNHSDLAPNFAELLLDVCNGLATISSFLATLLTGLIVPDEVNLNIERYAEYYSFRLNNG